MFQLLGTVHRVDRYHHRVGAQDGPMCDYELRAVLHVQHHPIPLLDPHLLQTGCQTPGLPVQFGIGRDGAKKHQRRLVRITQGTDGQVVPQGRGGRRDAVRNTFGPELVVGPYAAAVCRLGNRWGHDEIQIEVLHQRGATRAATPCKQASFSWHEACVNTGTKVQIL